MNKVLVFVILAISALVTAGIFVGLYLLVQYDEVYDGTFEEGPIETYEETKTFVFDPNNPGSVIDLQIDVDVTKIIMEYVSTSQYTAKLDMHYKITGPNAASKTYIDYFSSTETRGTNDQLSFRLEFDENAWRSITAMDNVLTVSLRKDTVFNIDAVSSTGGIEVMVPNGVTIGDFDLEDSTGAIILDANGATFTKGVSIDGSTGRKEIDFINCEMDGDMSLIGSTGSLNLNLIDMEYTKPINLNVDVSTGSIDVEIIHNTDMGNDVSGNIDATTGGINIHYEDGTALVGAKFSASTTTGAINFHGSGFTESGDVYTSNDFSSATNTYDLKLDTTTGSIEVDGDNS